MKKKVLIVISVLIVLAAGIFLFTRQEEQAVLEITPVSVVIKQGEAIPQNVEVKLTGKEQIVLDRKKDYTVGKFVKEVKEGKNCNFIVDTDGRTKGEFPIKVELKDDIKKQLEEKWSKKLEVKINEGTLKVERGIMPDRPMIALTFDDGPGPNTGKILDVLEQYDERATFFMLGNSAYAYPETVKRIYETGNEIANHSTTHADLSKSSLEKIRWEIDTASETIESACGQRPALLRPPYGAVSPALRENAGMPLIMWSIDTLDWKTRDTQNTIDVVMNQKQDGAIVLMHDIHDPSVEAAVQLIPKLLEEGYQLVTISELAQAKGIPLENGVKYFNFSE